MTAPVLFWFRRDLRLGDHPGLCAALETGGPVIPVFILDPETEALGTAPAWRLGRALEVFREALEEIGARLVFRRGKALDVLRELVRETGAGEVHWSRLYDPAGMARDSAVKAGLREDGLIAKSHPGHLLHEPWTVQTGQGSFYKVYTPYWKAVRGRGPGAPLGRVSELPAPTDWPESERLEDWALGRGMRRGAAVVEKHAQVGEAAANGRLGAFIAHGIDGYARERDRLDRDGTSRLSQNLSLGEISVRTCWHAGRRAMEEGKQGAETYLQELVWRDFAYHLMFHTPRLTSANWREAWDAFPWRGDNDDAERWRRGLTGEPAVDAAMREMYVTGTMHNRARMLVASYLTKHLMTHWQVGLDWFEDCLVDWDPASNALGWQWAAGSGPDATPYFRVFNPETQGEKFDPKGVYRRRWIAELSDDPGEEALDYFRACPESWKLDPEAAYPERMVDLKAGRQRALDAYQGYRNGDAKAAAAGGKSR